MANTSVLLQTYGQYKTVIKAATVVTRVSLSLFTEQLVATLSSGLTFIIQENCFFCSMNLSLSVSYNHHFTSISQTLIILLYSTEYRYSMSKYHNILVDHDWETLVWQIKCAADQSYKEHTNQLTISLYQKEQTGYTSRGSYLET